jgi:hypothetical protein
MPQESGDLADLSYREVVTEPVGKEEVLYEITINKYRSAYLRAKHPRILILFNEILEREYNDYRSGARWVWQDYVEGKLITQNYLGGGLKTDSSHRRTLEIKKIKKLNIERQISKIRRRAPSEWDTAQAKEVFTRPFLETGTHLVDPTTVIRSYAIETRRGSQKLSSRNFEFSAWQKYADVIVEFLFIWQTQKAKWQIFAQAVEIATGRILATVTSHPDAPPGRDKFPGERFAPLRPASPQAKEKEKGVQHSRQVAIKLMGQLAQEWNRKSDMELEREQKKLDQLLPKSSKPQKF